MNDVKNSLYEAYEQDEFEKLAEEIVAANAKDEANSLEEKIATSKELEQFYQSKIKDIAPFIVELKERANELNELRDEAEKKAKESELDPKNQELKEEALALIEDYSAVVEEITKRIEKKLRAGFTKLLESQQFDHETLFDTLKEYRSELKDEAVKQKEIREKLVALMEKGIQDKVDSQLGKEFSNMLLSEFKTYPEAMQKELKKNRLDKTEEVLLSLKTLADVYGYEKVRLTPDFIEKEMENIKSKIKLYIPAYEKGSKSLKELSDSKLSVVKIKLIKESCDELKERIEELKDKKKELEALLEEDRKMAETAELEAKKAKIADEIEKLEAEKNSVYEIASGVENEEQAKLLDEITKDLENKKKDLNEIEEKIKEINKEPEQQVQMNGLEALAQLLSGVYPAKKAEQEDVEMQEPEVQEAVAMEGIEYEPLTDEEKVEIESEIATIDEEVATLEGRVEKLDNIVKSKSKIAESFEELSEEQEDRINNINDEIAKYKLLKDLTEAIDRSKDISYQHLYI